LIRRRRRVLVAAIPTNWVAWYGAVVATAGVALTAYSHWRDSRRLRVVAKADMKIAGGEPEFDPDRTYIIIEVANVGRRPITLRSLPYFALRKGPQGLMIKGPWRPKERLEEGESASMFGHQEDFPFDAVKRVVVRDETGREWKGKIVRGVKADTRLTNRFRPVQTAAKPVNCR